MTLFAAGKGRSMAGGLKIVEHKRGQDTEMWALQCHLKKVNANWRVGTERTSTDDVVRGGRRNGGAEDLR